MKVKRQIIDCLRSLNRPLVINELKVLLATTATPKELQDSLQQLSEEGVIAIEQRIFKSEPINVTSLSSDGWVEACDSVPITVVRLV